MKKRLPYAVSFAVLLAVECLIGAFVHDSFVRPYVGDMLVTVLLCCMARTVSPEKPKLLALWVFIFSAAVETAQLFGIASAVAQENRLLSIALGSTFDPADIVCYFLGCAAFAAAEIAAKKRNAGAASLE